LISLGLGDDGPAVFHWKDGHPKDDRQWACRQKVSGLKKDDLPRGDHQ
jgi:hypothetical protein